MGGEMYLFIVYGFQEQKRWLTLPPSLPINLYTNSFSGSDIIYGTHPMHCEAVTRATLHRARKQAMNKLSFKREKLLMDKLARARGAVATWMGVIGGEFEIHARREEDDGFDSDLEAAEDEEDRHVLNAIQERLQRKVLFQELLSSAAHAQMILYKRETESKTRRRWKETDDKNASMHVKNARQVK
jgi:hypothetical protein